MTIAMLVLAAWAAAGDADDTTPLQVRGGTIEVSLGPEEPSVPRSAVLNWVRASAEAVGTYFGRFPVPRVRLSIVTGGRGTIGGGMTWGGGSPRIRVRLGRRTTQPDLDDDWVLTHEMTHLALPDLPDGFEWMEEGLATYLEPIARMRVGRLTPADVWGEMVENMPQGLPRSGDRGLDGTRAWGRTYWGGAIFWLQADVEIRQKTNNRKGLEDALRGVLAAGGDIRQSWAPKRVLAVADSATGLSVLHDMHERLGRRPGQVDLAALWRRLGVVEKGGAVTFDDHAPAAPTRRAIVTGS